MRIISSTSATTAAFALALLLATGSRPAEAGRACDELELRSPCIKSDDLKARISLKETGKDGRLQVKDADNATAVSLDGSSGNLTNLFSNLEDESNGLVKAWAQINADGTIAACWRCNRNTAETGRIVTGRYEVDFTPLATDISGRPRSATIRFGDLALGLITVTDHGIDASSVFVSTFDLTGMTRDRRFVLIIH